MLSEELFLEFEFLDMHSLVLESELLKLKFKSNGTLFNELIKS